VLFNKTERVFRTPNLGVTLYLNLAHNGEA
jgi:hypothetical protein